MSLSRQVLSSPFDVPQRPRTAPSKQNGDRKRVKEGGSSLANSNIMVDTRVVRRSVFNPSMAKNDEAMDQEHEEQQPGCLLFDSRLIKGDVFANPIVTLTGNQNENHKQSNRRSSRGRQVSTPPPVKGRIHVAVQTENTGRIDVGVCELFMSVRSSAQNDDSQRPLQDQIGVGEEGLPDVEPIANSNEDRGIFKESVDSADGIVGGSERNQHHDNIDDG